jgi:hypothetical protein
MSTIPNAIVFLIVGVVLTLLLVMALFVSRSSFFARCATTNICREADYMTAEQARGDPENYWIAEGGRLMVRRPTQQPNCFPNADQSVSVPYPQFCKFIGTDGQAAYYKQQAGGITQYVSTTNQSALVLGEDCFSHQVGRGQPMHFQEYRLETS